MIIRYDMNHAIPAERLEPMLALLNEAFPRGERRADEAQRRLLADPRYVVDLLIEGERVKALLIWWRLEGVRFIEHFAVNKAARNGGVGGRLLDGFLRESDCPVALEAELPENDIARRRIGFYKRHGLLVSDRAYAQQPLRPGDSETPMRLLFYPALPDDAEFDRVRHEIFRYVYNKRE